MLDIILTTLKPLLKNVTAEDVAASLYYLHLNTAEDARLLEAETSSSPVESINHAEKALPRKPLPESARSSLDISRYNVFPSDEPNPGQPKRKPVAAGSNLPARQLSERRPLGPRSLLSEASVTRKALPGTENRPPLRQYGPSQGTRSSIDVARNLKIQNSSKDLAKLFSITLIRRDPASGAQWNVGTISGHALEDTVSGRTKKPYFDMSIQLTNPGYNRFSAKQTSTLSADMGSASRDQSALAPFSALSFDRTLRMGGRPTAQHSRSRSDISIKDDPTIYSRDSLDPGLAVPIDTFLPSGQSSATGYTFLSPWQGQCQFTTSVSGRSLKCKHHLPAPISADSSSMSTAAAVVTELRFNLPSNVFGSAQSPDSKKRGGMEARRFSIPKFGNIKEKLNAYKNRPENTTQLDSTSCAAMNLNDGEQQPHLPPRPSLVSTSRRSHDDRRSWQQSPESRSGTSEDEDDRLDLSIGREKAGGGNRGKRAKLGKLIIHDEGFKMLDLVVAANMSVWWSVWEGS